MELLPTGREVVPVGPSILTCVPTSRCNSGSRDLPESSSLLKEIQVAKKLLL
jgi:hypothetical protein